MVASPYGFWTSPITSDLVVADAIRLDQVALDGEAIYWTEFSRRSRDDTFIYRLARAGEPEPVTPDDGNAFNVRTRVHEYGGGAFAVQRRHGLFLELCRSASLSPDGRRGRRSPITPRSDRGPARTRSAMRTA